MAGRALSWSWRGWLVPVLLSALAVVEVWFPGVTDARIDGPRWVLTLQALACCAALLVRRRRPLVALFAVCGILLAAVPLGWTNQTLALELTLVVVVFAAGRYAARPTAYLAVPLAASVILLGAFEATREWVSDLVWSLNALWIFALGAAFRREARVRDLLATASADAARADAADERPELAREVHDVVYTASSWRSCRPSWPRWRSRATRHRHGKPSGRSPALRGRHCRRLAAWSRCCVTRTSRRRRSSHPPGRRFRPSYDGCVTPACR